MVMNENGFLEPDLSTIDKETIKKIEKICPCFGRQCEDMDSSHLWGRRTGIYVAYANDKRVRYKASSGGVLTQLCCYLLDQNLVDGILHIGKDVNDPIGSRLFCSKTDAALFSVSDILKGPYV